MKKLIFLLMFPVVCFSQTISITGSPTQITRSKGGIIQDSITVLPVRSFAPLYPLVPNLGRLQIHNITLRPYFHNGTRWVDIMNFNNLVNKPATYPSSPHSHPASDISGLSDLYQSKGNYLTYETDPSLSPYIKGINPTYFNNGNTAFGWGNHAVENYLKSINASMIAAALGYTPLQAESDPGIAAFIKSITATDISNWNAAYAWGNHASQNYLKVESDPTVSPAIKAITATLIGNWNTSFSWGNHASQGYLKSETDPIWLAQKSSYSTKTQADLLYRPLGTIPYSDIIGKPKIASTYSGVTNSSGNYTVVFPVAYSVAPNIQANVVNQTGNNIFFKISISNTGFTVNVFQRGLLNIALLGDVLAGAVTNVTGASVDVLITEK